MPDNRGGRPRSIATSGTGEAHVGADYTPAEVEFLRAVEQFKQRARVRYPSAIDLLRLAVRMGYAPPGPVVTTGAETREDRASRVEGCGPAPGPDRAAIARQT